MYVQHTDLRFVKLHRPILTLFRFRTCEDCIRVLIQIKQFIDHVKKMTFKGIFLTRQNHNCSAFSPTCSLFWAQKTAALPGSSQKLFFSERFLQFDAPQKILSL